jgi:hypothetical protein
VSLDFRACRNAAEHGYLSILRWAHEQGMIRDVQGVRVAAANSGQLPVIEYMLDIEPAATAAQLTEMLNMAGAWNRLEAVQWLRQQGAEWPTVLSYNGYEWVHGTLQWARDEGCTSPV